MTSATGTARTAEVREYAAAVRAALADIPRDRSDELLEDLEEHLAEVAADGEESLTSRLGPPAAYAGELRAAAGLPAGPGAPSSARAGTAELVGRVRAWEPVRQVERFLPELRPAWWVVRAWAAVTAVDVVFVGGTSFPVPTLGLGPVGFLVTAAAIAWSVRLGLRARAVGHPAGVAAVVANAVLALLTLIALVGLAGDSDAAAEQVYVGNSAPEGLAHEDGAPITNILPYSSTGEPLTGVLLYDQDGRPIDDLADVTAEGQQVETVPDAPLQPGNAYPQQREVLTWDDRGNEVTVPMPLPTTAGTPAATPTAATASPTAAVPGLSPAPTVPVDPAVPPLVPAPQPEPGLPVPEPGAILPTP